MTLPRRPVRERYYRVGAEGSDRRYASKADALAAASAWWQASGFRPVVYRIDVTETWTPVRRGAKIPAPVGAEPAPKPAIRVVS